MFEIIQNVEVLEICDLPCVTSKLFSGQTIFQTPNQPHTWFYITWESKSRTVSIKAFSFSPSPWNFWFVMIFYLLCTKPFKSLCFHRTRSQSSNISRFPDFQTLPAPPNEFSNPDSGLSPRTHGWNLSAREIFAVDLNCECALGYGSIQAGKLLQGWV